MKDYNTEIERINQRAKELADRLGVEYTPLPTKDLAETENKVSTYLDYVINKDKYDIIIKDTIEKVLNGEKTPE